MKTQIIGQDGHSVSNKKYFMAKCPEVITKDRALEDQIRLGYHPAGYGFYSFHVEFVKSEGIYVATWYCQASCD